MSRKQKVFTSFMLFSLFFGAGNLIFPPFLGNLSAEVMPLAMFGFIITAVILPVLGVVVISKFKGLVNLGNKVNPIFSIIFTILIYLSIGPGLGIPRAASVPFEMAIAPYISDSEHLWIYLLIFSLIFFLIAGFLASNPSKLLDRVGKILTPILLVLIFIMFITYLIVGPNDVNLNPNTIYNENAFTQGFLDGYQTMDTIAALNFGLVISTTLSTFSIKEEDQPKYILYCGTFAGTILASIYIMLAYMGMSYGSNITNPENGAVILREISSLLFSNVGAIFLASIFLLACLTTCIGLITSISQFFNKMMPKVKYIYFVIIISLISFILCNQGLNFILEISIPILNAIYPIAITLILLGLFNKYYDNNKYIYPITISLVGIASLVHLIQSFNVNYGAFGNILSYIPLYDMGLGWIIFALVGILISIIIHLITKTKIKKVV